MDMSCEKVINKGHHGVNYMDMSCERSSWIYLYRATTPCPCPWQLQLWLQCDKALVWIDSTGKGPHHSCIGMKERVRMGKNMSPPTLSPSFQCDWGPAYRTTETWSCMLIEMEMFLRSNSLFCVVGVCNVVRTKLGWMWGLVVRSLSD